MTTFLYSSKTKFIAVDFPSNFLNSFYFAVKLGLNSLCPTYPNIYDEQSQGLNFMILISESFKNYSIMFKNEVLSDPIHHQSNS